MQDFVGKYQVLERIAGGGMADVYRGLATGPGGFRKLVAIKRIREHMSEDPEFVDMFVREATLAARMEHPNVVQVFEFNRDRRQYYLVMEFVQGLDLKTALERIPGPWNPALAFYIATKALAGLQYAHELADDSGLPLSVIHRDISPHNLLLSANGEVKLADFGIAKMRDAVSHTHVNMVRGKLPYLSPEQARGEPLDARSDLYSLGLVLWETLTGVRRFAHNRGADPLAEVMAGRFLPPSRLEPQLEPAVDQLLLGLLDPRRENRFDSAAQAREQMERLFPWDASSTLSQLIRAHQTLLPPPEESTILLARDERSDTWEFGHRNEDRPTTKLDRAVTREEPALAREPTDTVPVRGRPALVVELPPPRRKRRRSPLRAVAFGLLGLLGLASGYVLAPRLLSLVAGPPPDWRGFGIAIAEVSTETPRRVRLIGGQFDAPDPAPKKPAADVPAIPGDVLPKPAHPQPPTSRPTTAVPVGRTRVLPSASVALPAAGTSPMPPSPAAPAPGTLDPTTGLKRSADWE